MQGVLTAFTSAENIFALGKVNRAEKLAAVKTADASGTTWLTKAAKVLRISLGERWNAAWEATHFPDSSTQVPTTQDKRFTLLGRLATYFTANAGQEAPNQGVTAAAATALHTSVSNARDTLGQVETDQNSARATRDTALATLRKRVRSLIDELGTLLGSNDARWDAFGLSRPADPDIPLPATDLTVTPVGPGALRYTWKRGKRADYYRLFIKVLTVDADFRQLTNAKDLSHTATDLPPAKPSKPTSSPPTKPERPRRRIR